MSKLLTNTTKFLRVISYKYFLKFLGYSIVQLSAFLLDYIIFAVLIYFESNSSFAFLIAKLISILFCLYCHTQLVFVAKRKTIWGNLIYSMLVIVSPLASMLIFIFLSDVILNVFGRKFTSDLMIGIINFIIIDKLIFTEKKYSNIKE